ncbi:hypothetical protein KZ114_002389 [Enterococcus faecalis]|nr:hypothetical protein [Enterococcus faecalis]
MGIFNKKSYLYVIQENHNVSNDSFNTPEDLINFVINENTRLLESDEKGTCVITKIKVTKKGEEILYSQSLSLPMDPYTIDFDDLLSNFYTKKAIPHHLSTNDEQKESPSLKNEKTTLTEETPELSEELSILLAKGKNDLVDSEEVVEPKTNLAATVEAQQKEIDELKSIIQQKSSVSMESKVEANSENTEYAPNSSNNQSYESKQEEIQEVTLTSENDGIVTDVLSIIRSEIENKLTEFVETESAKIDQEIQRLDKRSEIEKHVRDSMKREEKEQLNRAEKELTNDKNRAEQEEIQRHEETMLEIGQQYQKLKAQRLTAIKNEYSEKTQKVINQEYLKQTKQLERILQGKKEELVIRQKDLNNGLKNDISQLLEVFNTNHNQIIETVEQQKSNNSPIDFMERLKRA